MGVPEITLPTAATPNGFWYVSEIPPGAGRATCLGARMKTIISSPVARKFATTTGRQRRDRKVPVGKRRSAQASTATTGKKSHSDTAPTC